MPNYVKKSHQDYQNKCTSYSYSNSNLKGMLRSFELKLISSPVQIVVSIIATGIGPGGIRDIP